MANLTILKLTHDDELGAAGGEFSFQQSSTAPRDQARTIGNYFHAVAGGARNVTLLTSYKNASAVQASGTVTISGGSGTETATINGVAIAITWATSDNNSASLLAAAINASNNALIAGIVTASAATNVVTITAVDYGLTGNCITTTASGTGCTAQQARLTGGVNPVYTTYTLR